MPLRSVRSHLAAVLMSSAALAGVVPASAGAVAVALVIDHDWSPARLGR